MLLPSGLSWPDPKAWSLILAGQPIPALTETADELTLLARIEHRHGCIDARTIAKAIVNDPLMTARVLVEAARLRQPRQISDAETITASLLMLGTGRFFASLDPLPTVEQVLGNYPEVADFLQTLIRSAHRSAVLAVGVALHRADDDAEAIQEASLLQNLAAMLLCCHAPALVQDWLTSSDLHHKHAELQQLNLALQQRWSLPDIVIRLSDDAAAARALILPQRQVVQLCQDLADCTATGWPELQLNALIQPAFLHPVDLEEELPTIEPQVPSEANSRQYHQQLLPALSLLMGLSQIAADHYLRSLEN